MTTADPSNRYEVSQKSKLVNKMKEAPFVPIGIAGTIAALGWGAYTYKNRGTMSTSVFLMHLRVKAQGMIVGAITLGVAYSLINDYVLPKNKPDHALKDHPKSH